MLGSAAGDLLRIVGAALAVLIVLAVTARQRARAYRAVVGVRRLLRRQATSGVDHA
ncbi:hypothetical protein [Pseudonocardia hierapolitana]|uniref:hypothetical protein n=1 Tax=Pseudonocardia hierapolitana TaxID=1128676 RepID=UPI0014785276|nr:hypothetical protein [Pseudonocardia hierapolitana]